MRPKGVTSRMLSQNQFVGIQTDVFGFHYFISHRVFQNPVLVNSGFMGKGVGPDNSLVWLNRNACNHTD